MSETYFTGEYPEEPERLCYSGFNTSGYAESWDNWRGFPTKRGDFIRPCPHCEHERAITVCEQIERIHKSGVLLYVLLDAAAARRMAARIRQRRKRNRTGVRYVTIPLLDGETVVLHNSPREDGTMPPSDRGELYRIVRRWVLQTPKGKRAGRGISQWAAASSHLS